MDPSYAFDRMWLSWILSYCIMGFLLIPFVFFSDFETKDTTKEVFPNTVQLQYRVSQFEFTKTSYNDNGFCDYMLTRGDEVIEEKITLNCNLNEREMKQEGNRFVKNFLTDNGRNYFQPIQDN